MTACRHDTSGGEPCPDDHCRLCSRHVNGAVGEQTCPGCVGKTRADLTVIEALHAALPAQAMYGGSGGRLEAARPIPGGAAAVMAGPVADIRAWDRRIEAAELAHLTDPGTRRQPKNRYPDHVADNRTDEAPPLLILASWEDDWRDAATRPAAQHKATITNAVAYLAINLDWAAQHHDAYDEFASDMRRLRTRLENVLYAGQRDERGAPCVRCATNLRRTIDDKGHRSDWACPRCHRTYTDNEYANANKAAYESLQIEMIGETMWASPSRAALQVGRPKRTIETWVREGRVARCCAIAGRRIMVSVYDAQREHERRQSRARSA